MKRILPVVFVAMTMTSCLYVVEPRVDYRDRVVGYYAVDEYSQTYYNWTAYSIRISRSSQGYDVINIDNFYASGLRVKAYVRQDVITIPYQVVDGFEIEGSGVILGRTMHLDYSVIDRYEWGPTDYLDAEAIRE